MRSNGSQRINLGGLDMKTWKKPQVREVCVGMEINAYFSARR